jgi:hypothetical protein
MVQEPLVYAELLVRLIPDMDGTCRVELAFTQPGSTAPTERSGRATFDVDELREVQNDVDEYGRRLTQALFADSSIREGFELATVLAGAQQLRLRLDIDAAASDLHALRWETLRTPDDAPVATGDRILFSRYLRSPDWRRVPTVLERELRALVMIANPTNLASYSPEGVPLQPINVPEEVERAKRGLGSIPTTIYSDQGTATLEHLIQAVRDGHNVVYLVCHGAFVQGRTRLYLERDSGETTTVTGDELADELSQLRQLPSLVVLASCQSAGSGTGGALAAVGPMLARAGVPSVLAMQDRVSMRTSGQFVETFFSELGRDGRLDRAAAAARTRVKSESDYWVPVLFSRLSSGCLWPPPETTTEFGQWPGVLRHIRRGSCTPIIGPGLIEFLLGPTREMAQRWADTYHFPMAPQDRQDLPQVAQFLAVSQFDPGFPAEELAQYVQREIIERYGQLAETDGVGGDIDQHVRRLVSEVGRRERAKNPTDPYRVLASLPFPIYVTANPDNLLADALEEAGKQPVVELSRWNDQADLPPSIWDQEPGYKPTAERPLVYHVFGQLRERQSLVLTEDNFFDFLLRIDKGSFKVPEAITAAWSKNALLFLAFQTDEWHFRVLFHTIMNQPGRSLGDLKPHVAVQIDPEEGSSLDPRRARKYLEQYFDVGGHISTYWGSTEKFMRELWFVWQQ